MAEDSEWLCSFDRDKSTFANAKTGGDGALVFNVENKENDQLANR